MTTVVIQQTGGTKVEIIQPAAIAVTVVNEHRIAVLSQGGQGSSAAEVSRLAADTVSALRVVSESSSGVRHLDLSQDQSVYGVLGVSVTGGSVGDTIKVKSSPGQYIDDSSWTWHNGFVFAGSNGQLTQNPPASGWEIVVGYAPSPTRLNLTFDEPLKLA